MSLHLNKEICVVRESSQCDFQLMPEYTSTERQCDSFLGYYQINIDVINDIYSCSSQDEGIDFSFFMAHKDDF